MNKIVIIHHPKDEPFTIKIARSLEESGAEVYIELQSVSPDIKVKTDFTKGLKTADVMVFVLSPESMGDEVLTGYWESFLRRGKPLVPIYRRECEPHYKLSRLQYVDFREGVVKYERGVNLLLLEMTQDYGLSLKKPSDSTIPDKRLIADIILAQTGRYASVQVDLEQALEEKPVSWIWVLLGIVILLISLVVSYFILVYEPAIVEIQDDTTPEAELNITNPTQSSSLPTIVPPTEIPISISLYHSDNVFSLTNISNSAIAISTWRFVSVENGSSFAVHEKWSGTSRVNGVDVIYALPRGSCLEAYDSFSLPSDSPHSEDCQKLQAWTVLMNESEIFWRGDFEVYMGDDLLATCSAEQNVCEILLNGGL